jgi:hypothetical protein
MNGRSSSYLDDDRSMPLIFDAELLGPSGLGVRIAGRTLRALLA